MTVRRRPAARLASCACLLALLGAAPAGAIEFNEIRLGPVLVNPTVKETVWYDSNIFLRGGGEGTNEQDFIFNFTGAIKLSVDRTRAPLRRPGYFDPQFLTNQYAFEQVLKTLLWREDPGGYDPDVLVPGLNLSSESVRALYTERLAAAVGYGIDTYNFADNSEFDSIDHNLFGELSYRSPTGLGFRVFDQFLYGNSVTSFRNRSVSQDTSLALTGSDFILNVLLANADYQVLDDYFLRLGYVWMAIRYSDDVLQNTDGAVLPGTIIPLVDLRFDGRVLDYDVHTGTLDFIVTKLAKTVITAQFLALTVQGAADDEIAVIAGGAGTVEFKDDPRDATVWQGTLHFQRQLTEKVRISLGGGGQYRDYVHNRIETVFTPPAPLSPLITAGRQGDRFIGVANFEAVWRVSPFTDLIASYDRNAANATNLDSAVVVNLITGRVRQKFGRKIMVEAGAQIDFEEITPGGGQSDRVERLVNVFLRPSWQIQKWLAVRGQYEFATRHSKFRVSDYDVHRGNLSVEASF